MRRKNVFNVYVNLFCLMLAGIFAQSTMAATINVRDFGAVGDGKTDDTKAFQSALDAACGKDETGGIVFVPQGTYLIAGHLNIPSNVTLEGIWQIPTAWTQYKGTTLLATEGEGNAEGTPFITLWNNSVIKGITIFYPNQVEANPPKPYPWTIATGGADNCSIIDVLLVNPYQAVDFGSRVSGRHYIRNLYGQPLYKGLFVDQCYDIGRVENVHFWPFWSSHKNIQEFIASNGEAFIFGRTDWEYVYNTFSWGYKIGYRFIKTAYGSANGNFLGIGADATNRAILVDECAPYGLLITNGEFVSMLGPHPVSVEILETNTGTIQFQNCAFWGPANQIAIIKGLGTVMFNNCNFVFWEPGEARLPVIEASGGNLIITSCNFNRPGARIQLNPALKTAVIVANRFAGIPEIENNSNGDVEIGFNATSKVPKEEIGAIVIDDSATTEVFYTEGKWYEGFGGGDYKELAHWAYKGQGECQAYWRPNLPHKGIYKVYVWYGMDPTGDHATNQPFIVQYKAGTAMFALNMKGNCGKWNLLGEFEFEKGNAGFVMTSNDADGNVVADAVKFVPVRKTPKRFSSFFRKIFRSR